MIEFSKTTLSNGLVVIAEQDLSTNLAAVNMLYKVGSRNEDPNKTGFAHLFEHLMFSGSKNANNFDQILQNACGESNAFTNADYTNYYSVLPFENIETALWLEADRMINLDISDEALSIEKKVVIEEFKEVCLNKPYGDNWHHLSALAYLKHPYNWPTIGKIPDHIMYSRIEDVQSFYREFYAPNNAILSVSSPIPTDEIFEMAEKWFGSINASIRKVESFTKEEEQNNQRYKKVVAEVPVPQFILGCHMPGRNDPDYYSCDLLTDILANGKSSRLYNTLITDKKMMSAVDCYVSGTFDPGLIILEGRPLPEVSIAQSMDALWSEIENLHENPPQQRELRKVKNKVISSLKMNEISSLNKAISMAYYEWLGSLDILNRQVDYYDRIDVEHILLAAKRYLSPNKASIVEYQPLVNSKVA